MPCVLLVQYQQYLEGLVNLGQGKFDPLDLKFVPEPMFANQLQFLIGMQFLKGSLWGSHRFYGKTSILTATN